MKNSVKYFILGGIIALAFLLRVLPFYNKVFAGGRTIIYDPDSYYHMRRVDYLLKNDFKILEYDSYLNYPDGSVNSWTPLYDQIAALTVSVFGGSKNEKHEIDKYAAWISPVIGTFTVIIIWLLGREIFSEKAGLLAALFFSVQPLHIVYSKIGNTDHHALEVFLVLTTFLFFMRMLRKENSAKNALLWGISAGFGMYLFYLTWPWVTIYVLMIVLTFVIGLFFNDTIFSDNEMRKKYFLGFIAAFTAAWALLLYPCLSSWHGRNGSVVFGALSVFQPAFLGSIIIIMLVMFAALKFSKPADRKKFIITNLYALSASLAAVIILIGLIFPDVFRVYNEMFFLKSEGAKVTYSREIFNMVNEVRPLFLDSNLKFSVKSAIIDETFLLLILPAAVFFLFRDYVKNKLHSNKVLLMLAWTLIAGVITLRYRRFGIIFGSNVSLLGAYLVLRPEGLLGKKAYKYTVTALCTALILFNISIYAGNQLIASEMPPANYDLYKWLSRGTPKTKGYYSAGKETPEYSVMNMWDDGNYIVYLGERAVVSSTAIEGIAKSVGFYTSSSEESAKEVLEKYSCRYIITYPPHIVLKVMSNLVESLKERFNNLPREEFFSLVFLRLHIFDGARPLTFDKSIEGLSNYRLVYESPLESPVHYFRDQLAVQQLKIFEYVKGAKFQGRSAPGAEILVTVPLETNSGRQFLYMNTVKCGQNGRFLITLPYSTQGNPYPVRALEKYKMYYTKTNMVKLDVSEKQVLEGENIR